MGVYSDSGAFIGVEGSRGPQIGYGPHPTGYAPSNTFTGSTPMDTGPIYGPKPIYQEQDISALYGASRQQVAAQQMLLYNAGYLSSSGDWAIGTMTQGYMEDQLRKAMGDANRNGLTLNELYDRIRAGVMKGPDSPFGSSAGSGGGYTGPTTTTTTSDTTQSSENVQLTGRGTARQLMIGALAQEIGREPNGREVSRFLRALNKEQRQHPSTSVTESSSTTTSTTDPDPKSHSTAVSTSTDATSSTTTKESKIDPGTEAEKFAEHVSPKEESRFEGAGFMDVIAQMLGV